MAGGEGAKERRRLKRLAAQGGDTSRAENKTKKNIPFKRNDARVKPMGKHQYPKKTFGAGAKTVGRFHKHSPKNQGAKSKFQTNKPKPAHKKNKPKKPKHLKRKLEQLGDEEAEEREAVLKKMHDWERKKEQFSGYQKNKSVEHSGQEEKDTPSNESNNGAGETEDFPRGGSISETAPCESPVVEDEPEISEKESMDDTEENTSSKKPDNDTNNETEDFPRGGSISETAPSESPAVEAEPEIPEKESMDDTEENTSSKKPDNDKNNDESDSDDEPAEARRQRGRRRRGRKDTAKQIAETTPADEDSTPDKNSGSDAPSAGVDEKEESKKQKDPNRYCTGRKPVTDYVVGQCYTGKVVYVKPFGVFIDIGCHSDAFCHVSRLSDDYVESAENMFKEGDELKPRIVEIDRRQKKITVSLQSEAKIADEQKSIAARKERKESRSKSRPKPKLSAPKRDFSRDDSFRKPPASYKPAYSPPVATEPPKPKATPILPPDESTMTPAELKRARKLARRAARREQTETENQ